LNFNLWERGSETKAMPTHHATCSCGQLRVTCDGDPVRVSICHCLACQRRTGSVFGAQARFPRAQVRIEGQSTVWSRSGDSGSAVTFHFCPACGATVYWRIEAAPELIAVAIGAFADPGFGPPRHSVYERNRHGWVVPPDGPGVGIWTRGRPPPRAVPLSLRKAANFLRDICSDMFYDGSCHTINRLA
jgi:hypothetical protein